MTPPLLLNCSISATPSVLPPEVLFSSSYMSSIIGFHSRTRAFMNQFETLQCKKERKKKLSISLGFILFVML
uniref:Uncharacterized protein n=1 Tax=Oryza brachyantha TaxID=4533 RepID=J3MF25_ORYBR